MNSSVNYIHWTVTSKGYPSFIWLMALGRAFMYISHNFTLTLSWNVLRYTSQLQPVITTLMTYAVSNIRNWFLNIAKLPWSLFRIWSQTFVPQTYKTRANNGRYEYLAFLFSFVPCTARRVVFFMSIAYCYCLRRHLYTTYLSKTFDDFSSNH